MRSSGSSLYFPLTPLLPCAIKKQKQELEHTSVSSFFVARDPGKFYLSRI